MFTEVIAPPLITAVPAAPVPPPPPAKTRLYVPAAPPVPAVNVVIALRPLVSELTVRSAPKVSLDPVELLRRTCPDPKADAFPVLIVAEAPLVPVWLMVTPPWNVLAPF